MGDHLADPTRPNWWLTTTLVAAVVLASLFAVTILRTEPTPITPTAAAGMIDQDTAALATATAQATTCRRLVLSAAALAGRLDHQFHLHHQAHMAMVSGKISKAERNRIWTATLASRAQLSPLLQGALKAVKDGDCQ